MRVLLGVVLIATMFFAGCKNSNNNTNTTANANAAPPTFTPLPPIKPLSAADPNFKPCNPYFPLIPGSLTKHVINYSSGLVADATVVVDSVEENGRKVFVETTQIVDKSGGAQKAEKTVRKYTCDGDRVQLISENTENRIEGNLTTVEYRFKSAATTMIGLSDLARKGANWSYSVYPVFHQPGKPPAVLEEPVVLAFEVQGEAEVTVPLGKFKALKVLRTVNQNKIVDSYVRGIGLVKRDSSEGTSWVLKEYSGLSPAP
jgi:PBP1b-binding outer membrane lipoprotein LpoB